jgi:salicylate hydroxylase
MRVLIAGGGIGGLVAAIALAQRDIEVEVFEQQTEPREVGAGIAIFANGARVISSLGIDAVLEPLRHYSPGFRIRRGKSGRLIAELPLGGFHEERFGARAYDLHRSDLRQALLEAAGSKHGVTVHLGQRVAKVIQDQGRVTLETDQGLRASGEALIGADGIHSVVRREIAGPDVPRFSGEVVWRALVPRDRLSGIASTPFNTVWTGGDRHFLQYPVRGGGLLNVGGFVRSDRWRGESWTERGDQDAFAALYSEFHPAVREIVGAIDECFVQAIHERSPLEHWFKGRVVLLGDACHAMPPHMGQGAGMAIEDGVVLARAIAERPRNPEEAFRVYQAKRQDRVQRLLEAVRWNASMFRAGNPVRRAALDLGFWLMSRLRPTGPQEDFAWVYEYDALRA